jgi:hypothetical protein
VRLSALRHEITRRAHRTSFQSSYIARRITRWRDRTLPTRPRTLPTFLPTSGVTAGTLRKRHETHLVEITQLAKR